MGRRDDGYHNLASLFQAIDLGDHLTIKIASQDRLHCNCSHIPLDRTNLVWKAVDLFKKKSGISAYFDITLFKNIPSQAGLGGGSSNGATTLWGLNTLFGSPASVEELRTWSAEIGSDLPFFFSEGTAYCTGRGEHVKTLSPLKGQGWIVKPKEGLSTQEIFRRLSLKNCSQIDPEIFLDSFFTPHPKSHNDLEEPAFEALPFLKSLKESLLASGSTAIMSGSGTAFFCVGNKPIVPEIEVNPVQFIHRSFKSWYISI